jgi:hypothetical protein
MTKPHWLTWRAARWAVLGAAIPALWACNSRRLAEPMPAPEQTFNDLFQQSINRNIDIVFMVDNSSSMTPLQQKLTDQFPVFMNVLKGLPNGLPNVHIGVVSSSMGAGKNPSIAGCMPGGDQGIFQSTPTGNPACQRASLNADQHFIINNMGTANYTGDISDVFGCIAQLGDQGCGFEHQFESVLRALGADGGDAPTQNAGFLRDDAYLAVVLITNEDDCSAPPNSDLFSSDSSTVDSPLGPLQSYRCNEFGHLCGGQKPPRQPMGEVDLTGTCVSAEDGTLLRVSDVVAALKSKKQDPSKILVAAIAGPPAPYKVALGPSQVKGDTSMWPYVEHSCTHKEPPPMMDTYADPAIRIKQWVDAFGSNGLFEEICNDTFKDALNGIANEIGKKIGSPCVTGTLISTTGQPWKDTDPTDIAQCSVVDHTTNMAGTVIDSTLQACPDMASRTGATPCWYLTTPAPGTTSCPANSHVMGFNRGPNAPLMTDLNSSVSCSVVACPPAGQKNPPPGCQ